MNNRQKPTKTDPELAARALALPADVLAYVIATTAHAVAPDQEWTEDFMAGVCQRVAVALVWEARGAELPGPG